MPLQNQKIAIVIPIHNEEKNIIPLDMEIRKVMSAAADHQIIYVDDGSTDGSFEELQSVALAAVNTNKNIRILNIPERQGQTAALRLGFEAAIAAQADIIISMDGDGQHDPADIPRLLEELENGSWDVVTGWRKERRDKMSVRINARIGSILRRFLFSSRIHDFGCTLRVYRRAAIENLRLDGEMHRYIIALIESQGFRVGEVVVNHRHRRHGKSKYTMAKVGRGTLDLIKIKYGV